MQPSTDATIEVAERLAQEWFDAEYEIMFGDLGVRSKQAGLFDNCGTGAGGFKEDNTCATGSSAADSEKPKKRPLPKGAIEAMQEYREKQAARRAAMKEVRALQDRINDSADPEEVLRLSEERNKLTDAHPRVTFPAKLAGMNLTQDELVEAWHESNPLSQSEDRENFDARLKRQFSRPLHPDTNQPYSDEEYNAYLAQAYLKTNSITHREGAKGIYESMTQDQRDFAFAIADLETEDSGFASIRDEQKFKTAMAFVKTLPVSELNAKGLKKAVDAYADKSAELDETTLASWLPHDSALPERDLRDGLFRTSWNLWSREDQQKFENTEWDDYSTNGQQLMIAAHNKAAAMYDTLGSLDNPLDMSYVVEQERIAIAKHFAKEGILANVSTKCFERGAYSDVGQTPWVGQGDIEEPDAPGWGDLASIPRDKGAEFTGKRKLQLLYEQVISADDAVRKLKAKGVDLNGLQIDFLTDGDSRVEGKSLGFYEPKQGRVNLITQGGDGVNINRNDAAMPVDFSVLENSGNLSTAMHEIGHALHHRKIAPAKKTSDSWRMRSQMRDLAFENTKISSSMDKSAWMDHWREEAGLIENELSTYGRSSPIEFVAEAFTLKNHNPRAWDVIKGSGAYRYTNLTKDKPITSMTLEELYEALGGP